MAIQIKKRSSKKTIQRELSKAKTKGFPAQKFTGKIRTKEDAVALQKKLRNEWE